MVTIKPKAIGPQKLEATCPTHARTDVTVRGLKVTIDEPSERGGTNRGLTPTETLWAALLGCTNVIAHRVAEENGVHFETMQIRVEAMFDRRGAQLMEEVDRPFPEATLFIEVKTNADEAKLAKVKRELGMYCPVSKVLRQAGTKLTEVWMVTQ